MNKKKARIALRKSIKHWCLDIRRPFLNGDFIDSMTDIWVFSGMRVKMYTNHCELCRKYSPTCNCCPLNIISEKCCSDNSAYDKFYDNLNIESANNMITVLIKAYRVAMSEGKER